MKFSHEYKNTTDAIIRLFETTFAASEGPKEGRLIATLVENLVQTTKNEDLFVFSALIDDVLVGCIAFSRITFAQDDRTVFILSPVAVDPSRQGTGIGQTLLAYGLHQLREHGVDLAVTYGDPNYYNKVGFTPVTEAIAKPPLPLTQPEGWLAQSLTGRPIGVVKGASHCVDALNDPAYW